jgi:hypothetical protein
VLRAGLIVGEAEDSQEAGKNGSERRDLHRPEGIPGGMSGEIPSLASFFL